MPIRMTVAGALVAALAAVPAAAQDNEAAQANYPLANTTALNFQF